MDENGVNQQYYIATKSSPADDRTRVLKHGRMFAVFDRYGDIETFGLREQGIFYEGTRFLSQSELFLGGVRPLLLSSTVKTDNSMFTADLANVDIVVDGRVVVPRGTVHVARTQFLWDGACYQQFRVVNYGLVSVDMSFRIRFGADFADIFEVRGVVRKRKGVFLPATVDSDCVVLSYQGLDGATRRTTIQCDPAPKRIKASELQFDAFLEPRAQTTFTVIVSCETYSNGRPQPRQRSWKKAVSEIENVHFDSCKIVSSSEEFNDWVKRSQSDVQMMILGNPERNYPYAGVPWFSTVFGRDGLITALECLWLSPAIAYGVLQFLALTQAHEVIPDSAAEPGKILHEMRKGEMAALGEVPFGQYYGTVDATPLFIMLADACYTRTGDRNMVERFWPHIERALQWIDQFGDQDGDGFVEYFRESDEGLIHQGWKDSNDSVFHENGQLAEGPIALCEVQGYVYAAKRGAARLARVLGNQAKADELESQAAALRTCFHQAFWLDDMSTYALALDGEKRPCRIRTSNAGQCLYTGIAPPEAAVRLAHTLLRNDSYSGWGIRTVASGESRYNPLSYHNGSVWPHDNAMIAVGLARYGLRSQAAEIFSAMLAASSFIDLHRLPELFCGLDRRSGEGPTLYPVACSPQTWAAGAVFMLLQACLGVSLDAQRNQIRFDGPHLPESIPQLWITDLKLGDSSVDIFVERRANATRLQMIDRRGNVELVVT